MKKYTFEPVKNDQIVSVPGYCVCAEVWFVH